MFSSSSSSRAAVMAAAHPAGTVQHCCKNHLQPEVTLCVAAAATGPQWLQLTGQGQRCTAAGSISSNRRGRRIRLCRSRSRTSSSRTSSSVAAAALRARAAQQCCLKHLQHCKLRVNDNSSCSSSSSSSSSSACFYQQPLRATLARTTGAKHLQLKPAGLCRGDVGSWQQQQRK
jgi:hypothetical protein